MYEMNLIDGIIWNMFVHIRKLLLSLRIIRSDFKGKIAYLVSLCMVGIWWVRLWREEMTSIKDGMKE